MEIFRDFIHLTQGELLVKYWWFWLICILGSFVYFFFDSKEK